MANRTATGSASVGVADHCGWAILVTVAPDGTLVDRRRVDLVDDDLPKLPHHHDAQGLPAREAAALIERVKRSAEACAAVCLHALATTVPMKIAAIALRTCPPLPETIAERLSDYRAQNVADTVMYRTALAQAAEAKGWTVHWYEVKHVQSEAARALGRRTIVDLLEKTGTAVGRPWQKDHRVAMAAAIAVGRRR